MKEVKPELTNKVDDPLFSILRDAYLKSTNEANKYDNEAVELQTQLANAYNRRDAAKKRIAAAEKHANSLGWTLVMPWETEQAQQKLNQSRGRGMTW
jgi:hypothetical protein